MSVLVKPEAILIGRFEPGQTLLVKLPIACLLAAAQNGRRQADGFAALAEIPVVTGGGQVILVDEGGGRRRQNLTSGHGMGFQGQ